MNSTPLSEELGTPASADDSSEVGPGQLYAVFLSMESLLDKLKLLNHDEEFVMTLKMKPFNRHYFAIQTNPGEQFYLFTSLAAWLIRKSGQSFDQPHEYDDPNSTISSILDTARKKGMTVDFPPNRLKQGYGPHVVMVLQFLANDALQVTNFKWQKPEILPEREEENDIVDDDSELILERIEEEMAAEYSDDEDEILIQLDDLHTLRGVDMGISELQKPDDILESNVSVEDWQLEIERVLPHLKVTIKSDQRDWRSHFQQMQSHVGGIQETLSSTKSRLEKLHSDIAQTMDKIGSREKYLNSQLETVLNQLRALRDELSVITERYSDVSGGVTERTRTLALLSEELESVKQEMEERGSSMTDGTPLVYIKRAVSRMKSEIVSMEVQIGVLEHSLLQARLKDKTLLQQDMITPYIAA